MRPNKIDVVIPTYGQRQLSLDCISSVLSGKNPSLDVEIVVIDDCGPDPDLLTDLRRLASAGEITLIENPRNLGFPQSCNKGIRLHDDRDVVILNSDCLVFGDWLERLHRAAYSRSNVFSVTPLTNDGTICSYPQWLESNSEPEDITFAELDQLASEVNSGISLETPTGVGFCMYLRRDGLDQVGLFDEEKFGRGYGEENELSLRAQLTGWVNLVTADVFVAHLGGGSFGTEKGELERRAVDTVERLYPGYNENIRKFIEMDGLSGARRRLDSARVRRNNNGTATLLVTHTWGGGTERHVQELAKALEKDGIPTLVLRPSEAGPQLVHIESRTASPIPNLSQLDLTLGPEHLAEVLSDLGITHVHVHNLAGYPDWMPDFIRTACLESGISYDLTVHDYQSFCPRIDLVDVTNFYCGEPGLATCQECVLRDGFKASGFAIWEWRARHSRLLEGAENIFAPSHDCASRMTRHFPEIQISVRPHIEDRLRQSVELVTHRPRPNSDAPFHILVLGNVGIPKGSRVLRKAAEASLFRRLPLRFTVLGITDLSRVDIPTNVNVRGSYEEDNLPGLISQAEADLVWFPAVWPETYSYTLTYAMASGLPVVAFDIGAISERLSHYQGARVLPLEVALDSEAVADFLHTTAKESRKDGTRWHDNNQYPDYSNILSDYYGRPRDA